MFVVCCLLFALLFVVCCLLFVVCLGFRGERVNGVDGVNGVKGAKGEGSQAVCVFVCGPALFLLGFVGFPCCGLRVLACARCFRCLFFLSRFRFFRRLLSGFCCFGVGGAGPGQKVKITRVLKLNSFCSLPCVLVNVVVARKQ